MSASAEPTEAPRFHIERPTDLRRAGSTHRLAYVIRVLPERLRALSPQLRVPAGGRVLDFGCAEMPYRSFFTDAIEVVGADLPGNPHAAIEIQPDGTVPVPEASFDAVLSTQVLEHVRDPATYLEECHRVLRPGGRLLLSTHGIMVYHPDPVDLWRWTSAGLREAVRSAGFEVVAFEGIVGLGATGLQLLQDAFVHRLPPRLRGLLCGLVQRLMAVVDRFEPAASRDGNALVFALVAEKPCR